MTKDKQEMVLALVRDLLFGSRIGDAVIAAGRQFTRVGTPQQLLSHIASDAPELVIVDLGGATPDLAEIAQRASGARLVAFGPHVDAERLRSARRAGFHEVVTNGMLVRDLPALLARNLPPHAELNASVDGDPRG
ncbi:MAG: hypothetical protein WKH64_09810 [Chloroflexia bacterium]